MEKRNDTFANIFATFILVYLIWKMVSSSISCINEDIKTPSPPRPLTKKEKIHKLFSPWDGSNYELVKYVKKTLRDPASFQHSSTVYWDKGKYIKINMLFRAKNGYGGYNIIGVNAFQDINTGNLWNVEIIE